MRTTSAASNAPNTALDRLASPDIDRDTLINAVHVPPDAGPYAPALERILRRIPDGFAGDHDRVPARVVVSVDRGASLHSVSRREDGAGATGLARSAIPRGYVHSQRAGERVEAVAALAADSLPRVPGDSRPGDASPGR
jgi:hypothetical protein